MVLLVLLSLLTPAAPAPVRAGSSGLMPWARLGAVEDSGPLSNWSDPIDRVRGPCRGRR
jgi:hypothetical protein